MKILFYGVGSIGQRHIKNLRDLYGDECSIISFRSNAYGNEVDHFLSSNNVKVYFNENEAYAKNPDIVFVTNPTFLHYRTIKQAINHNCHVFVEKPICLNLNEIIDLDKSNQEKNLVVFIGYCLRYNKLIKSLKNKIEENVLGKLYTIDINFSSYLPKLHPWRDYKNIYRNKKENGGDVIYEFSHELDYMFWIFGKPLKINAKFGQLGNFESDVDDFFSGLVEMESSAILQITLSYLSIKPKRYCRIVGEKGVAEIDLIKNSLKIFNLSGNQTFLYKPNNFETNKMYIDEVKDYIDCVKNNLPSPINLDQSKDIIKFIDLAKKASKEDKAVSWS